MQVPPLPLLLGVPGTFSEGRQWGGVEGTLVCGPAQLPHLLEAKTLCLSGSQYLHYQVELRTCLPPCPRSTVKLKYNSDVTKALARYKSTGAK